MEKTNNKKSLAATLCFIPTKGFKPTRKVACAAFFFFLVASPCYAQPDFNKIVDSIYKAEGGAKAKKPFGILSVPCHGYESCRKICFNTVRNSEKRWIASGKPGDFIAFLGKRYCPIGAENDNGTNRFWVKNVKFFLSQM